MKTSTLRKLSLLMAILLIISIMSACNTNNPAVSEQTGEPSGTAETGETESPAVQSETAPSEEDKPAPTDNTDINKTQDPFDTLGNDSLVMELPITDEPVTLSYFISGLSDVMPGILNTYADHIQFLKAEEITGVHIEFTEIANMAFSEKFNLMVISEDYTDMVMNAVNNYSGGSAKAIEDEFIIPLNDLAKEHTPLYMDVINTSESLQIANLNDNGDMPQFFAFMSEYVPNNGMAVRADWLEELGMQAPVTYDEYYEYLKAAQVTYNPDHPIVVTGYAENISMGMGTPGFNGNTPSSHLFQKDGKVTSSFREQGYKDYIAMMHKWYEEGLINENFYSTTSDMMQAETVVFSGETALWPTSVVHLKRFLQESGIEGASVVGIRDAVNTDDEIHHFGGERILADNPRISITTACEYPEVACKWINFWFTQEGRMMASYGTLGLSYEIGEDGTPYYTDMVVNNPDGWIYAQCTTYFCLYNHVATLFDRRKNWGTYADYQIDALLTWRDSGDGAWHLPGTLSLSVDEYDDASLAMADISTYAAEYIIRFITGEKSMSEWDDMVSAIENMGLETVIQAYQNALDRYYARINLA